MNLDWSINQNAIVKIESSERVAYNHELGFVQDKPKYLVRIFPEIQILIFYIIHILKT